MKGADCKLPIQEDFRSFLNNGKTDPSSKQKKLLFGAGFLLVVAMSIMIGFTFRALTEISELRQEIDQLKSSVQTLHKKVIDDPDYSDFAEDQTQFDYNDDYYDISYEDDTDDNQSTEDYYKDNNIIRDALKPVLTGEQYTKDAKHATVPPRAKRNIVGYTHDGIPINADSYDEAKRKNVSTKRNYFSTTIPPSSYPNPFYARPRISQEVEIDTTPKSVYSKRAKSLQIKNSNYIKSSDFQHSEENPDVEFTVVGDDQISRRTRHRQRRVEEFDESQVQVRPGRMRPLPTAHFNGDTSKYVLGRHDNFGGNGRLRHPRRTFVDWAESSWFSTLGMDRHFSLYDGVLTIKDAGLYFIYAQIYYLDVHDTNGFRVYRNESETLLQCTTMTHSIAEVTKGNTCFTAAAEYLHENDRISLGDLSESRYSLFEPGKSFFGVIKLGDVKIK